MTLLTSTLPQANIANIVTLTGTVSVGDWVCSANDPTDPSKVTLATSASLLNSNAVIGVMLQSGTAGQQKLMAPSGFMVDAATTGIVVSGAVASSGTTPPVLTLIGTATIKYNLRIECTLSGARGVWQFRWSINGGAYWTASNVVSAATVVLTGTGLTLNIATGNAAVDNVWTATNYTDIILNTTTSRAARGNPLSTDYILGTADGYGNSIIRIKSPGTIVDTNATNGNIIASDGYTMRSRRAVYNFLDFKINGVGPDETGAIDCSPHLQYALNTIPNYSDLYIPLPTGTSGFFKLANTIKYYDDVEHGNKRGIRIIGEGNGHHTGDKYHFRCAMTRKSGTQSCITARTNGGSGDFHQTIWLDGYSVSGILAADASRWVGRWFVTWNCANDSNNGEHIIISVPNDGYLRVSNINSGSASGNDANNGTICWAIDEPLFDMRARDIVFKDISIGTLASSNAYGCNIEFTHPPGSGAVVVLRDKVHGCSFSNATGNNNVIKDHIWVARHIVPTSSGNGAWRGLNGLGEFQIGYPYQADTFFFHDCSFNAYQRMGIAFWSTTAQCKENRIVECQFGPGRVGVGVPRDYKPSTVWVANGFAHWDIYRCGFATVDTAVQIGGYGSKEFIIEGCYSEVVGMILNGPTGGTRAPVCLRNNTFTSHSSAIHGSGNFIKFYSSGPLVVDGGYYYTGLDGTGSHIELGAIPANDEVQVAIKNGFWMYGRSDYTVRFGIRTSSFRGPYKFAGTENLALKVDGAAAQEKTLSQANFNSALGYTANLNEIHLWELVKFIQFHYTGVKAWSEENTYIYIRSATNGTTGSIQCVAPGSGVDADTKIGFGSALGPNSGTQSRLSKDTSGLVDWSNGAGSAGGVDIEFDARLTQNSPFLQLPCNQIKKRVNSKGYGRTMLENIGGISSSNGVQPKNLWTNITISDGYTTALWDGYTAINPWNTEEDALYKIIPTVASYTGTPTALSLVPATQTKATTSFILTTAAPGVGSSVTWHLELRR